METTRKVMIFAIAALLAIAFSVCMADFASAEDGSGVKGDKKGNRRGCDKKGHGGKWGKRGKHRRGMMVARLLGMSREDMIDEFDEDGDGKLSKEERKTAMTTLKARLIEKYDEDGDGKLSNEERKTARKAAREAFKQKMLDKYDTDGDGKLDDDEKEAMKAAMKKRRKGRKGKGGDRRKGCRGRKGCDKRGSGDAPE